MRSFCTTRRQGLKWIAAAALASMRASSLWAGEAKPLATIEGKLVTTRGVCPVVKTNGREQALSANTPALFHTLQDKRLDGRDVRLEGIAEPNGSFEVHWLYTLHDGKVFKVRSFRAPHNI